MAGGAAGSGLLARRALATLARPAGGYPDDRPLFVHAVCGGVRHAGAQAVTQHLGLLGRAYWLDPADPDGSEGRRWLHAAPFAPARAAMEGTAMSGWLLDPEPDPDERVRRGAARPSLSGRIRRSGRATCGPPGWSSARTSATCGSCGPARTPGRCRSAR